MVTEPDDLVIHDKESEFLRRCELLIREMPGFTRFGFLLLLRLFDALPFLFGFGPRRFVRLSEEARRSYVDVWMTSHSMTLKEIFKGIRGMVMVCYFSHPDIWAYIGYDPIRHVTERKALREKILREQRPAPFGAGQGPVSSEAGQGHVSSEAGQRPVPNGTGGTA